MKLPDILLALSVAMLWGGNFIAAKFGMTHLPPFLLSALRFALVAALVVPFVRMPSRGEMRHIFWLALVLGTLHFAFAISGMYHGLDIATSIITIQLGTPISCALGTVFLGDRLGMWRTLGLLVAFTGILLVVGTPQVSENYGGFLMVLFAAFTFGAANVMMKRMPPMPVLPMVGWMSLLSAPQIALLSLLFERGQIELLRTMNWTAALSIAYSAVGSSIVAYTAWYYLIRKYNVSQVAPFSLLTPFFGIALGQWFFAEPLGAKTLAGGLVTLLGVGIITVRRPKTVPIGRGAG